MSSTQEVGEIFGAGAGPAHAMLRSPTVLIASVGLFGCNILIFRIFSINYVKVLNHDLMKLKSEELDIDVDGDSLTAPSSSLSPGSMLPPVVMLHIKKLSEASVVPLSDDEDNNNTSGDYHHHQSAVVTSHTLLESQAAPAPPIVNDAITWNRLVSFSVSLLFWLHFTSHVWIEVLGGGFIGAIFSFYGSVIAVILLPMTSLQWLRKACVVVFQRTFELINPRCHCVSGDSVKGPRPIPFVDVFFADAMCSLSKVFFDMGMLLHMMSHYPGPVLPSTHNIVIPSACAAVPYLIRARQCLVMHAVGKVRNDPKRGQHIQNAIKYSTSLWPLFLSAYQKCIPPDKAEELELPLLVLLTVNASYSLYWDVVMDWGMMQNASKAALACSSGVAYENPDGGGIAVEKQPDCAHAFLRPRLRFGFAASISILLTDAILRFSWLLRFYHAVFPSADAFVLCTQFLEVFRRAIWNLLRVEWEHIKQQQALVEKEVSPGEEEKVPFLRPQSTVGLPPSLKVPARRPNSSL